MIAYATRNVGIRRSSDETSAAVGPGGERREAGLAAVSRARRWHSADVARIDREQGSAGRRPSQRPDAERGRFTSVLPASPMLRQHRPSPSHRIRHLWGRIYNIYVRLSQNLPTSRRVVVHMKERQLRQAQHGGAVWAFLPVNNTPPGLRHAPCMWRPLPWRPLSAGCRSIGEQAGLAAIADRSATVRRHDALGPAGVGDTMVDAYASWGFTVSGVAIEGAVLLLPRASFLLSVDDPDELAAESLAVLDLLDIPVGMLVIGCGRRSRRVPPGVHWWLHNCGMAVGVEALATPHACSTFNFMVQEQRSVAALLWPIGEKEVEGS